MKNKTFYFGAVEIQHLQSSHILFERRTEMSLSKQAKLANNALLVGRILDFINDIEITPHTINNIDTDEIEEGIQVIVDVKKGNDYLSQRKNNLMQRPDSADTVGFIKERLDVPISESSEIVISTLNDIKEWPVSQAKINTNQLEFVKRFLRAIHTGIMDQLEAPAELSSSIM